MVTSSSARVAVVAIDMGYGHMRPARALAQRFGCEVLHADRPPLADAEETARWGRLRRVYEGVSRISSLPLIGAPLRAALNTATHIPPLYPFRDLSVPNLGVKLLERSGREGLGRSLVAYLQDNDLTLLTTFYSPAVLADYHGYDRVYCVVTDSDVNRVWAPIAPRTSKVHYFAPSGRVVRRLRAYGVPKEQIELTGFPLPHALVGGNDAPALRKNLAARLARLDPQKTFRRQYQTDLEALGPLPEADGPPHLVFAVGGAGAQSDLPARFLPSLSAALLAGELRLTLVAGSREDVRRRFEQQIGACKLEGLLGQNLAVLYEPDTTDYFERFEALLAHTDILWTKPSELVFYAGLGLPLLLSEPVGIHESYNRRFARENGAALKQRDPTVIAERLRELLEDGHLATAAWAGYRRMPHRGLYEIEKRIQTSWQPRAARSA
jgi:UDP-N-acetylglucosamine:LPS N-acetylglucosamine transferase